MRSSYSVFLINSLFIKTLLASQGNHLNSADFSDAYKEANMSLQFEKVAELFEMANMKKKQENVSRLYEMSSYIHEPYWGYNIHQLCDYGKRIIGRISPYFIEKSPPDQDVDTAVAIALVNSKTEILKIIIDKMPLEAPRTKQIVEDLVRNKYMKEEYYRRARLLGNDRLISLFDECRKN